jgi:cell division protein FtsI (penicillin-binding protein 3)
MVERRLIVLGAALALWSAAVAGKLASLQLVHHQELARKARAHQEVARILPAPRGSIYDRNGQPLAMSLPTQSVTVNPLKLPDVGVAAGLLEQVLHMQGSGLYDKLKQAYEKGRGYFVVKRQVTPVEAENVRALPVDWIQIESTSQRHYPKGTLAAHVLGGVDFEEKGNAGIEKALEETLHGEPGEELLLTDVKRRGIASRQSNEAKPGTPITLTIDERLQFEAERQLAAAVELRGATSGSVVVMNPSTGDVLALASYPAFDPNDPPEAGGDAQRQNHAISVPFEPGSVFKIITLSAALETTNLRPETPIDCGRGSITLFGRTIHEAEAHGGYGVISMAQVLQHSSNVGAIRVGTRVGQQNLYDYVRHFGFAQLTGLPLPGESRGKLRKVPQWTATSLASISIGQEVSVTTVQLAQAVSVIANGGLLVKPRLVLKFGSQPAPQEPPVRAIKAETAFTMRQMMEAVVMPGGTGYPEARLAGYSAAGKTGTALIFDFAAKRYTHNYNASFAGMAPLTNPSIVVVVTLNGTHGDSGYGGRSAAPVFNKVATEALRILEVPRDVPDDPTRTLVAAASKAAPANDLALAGLGAGPNILQDADDDEKPAPRATPAPRPNEVAVVGPTVPNFRGMTMRDVLAEAASRGLTVLPDGSGVARIQYPAPGSVLHQGERIRVRFAR